MMYSHVYITKAIRIDDKEIELKNIKKVMDRMKWKLKNQTQDTLLFISPIRLGLFMDEITVTFNDMEVEMDGPREYVEKAISRCNFLYTPYEIKKLEQEG
jgi:translation elongation factor EF-1beta